MSGNDATFEGLSDTAAEMQWILLPETLGKKELVPPKITVWRGDDAREAKQNWATSSDL